MAEPKRPVLSVDDHVRGVLDGDRAVLARTITLVESNRRAHQEKAQAVLTQLLPHAGGAVRLGITGVPGVGKSTFIERFGMDRVEAGSRVAVLAVDPSSSVRGGSILGDKTRMNRLSTDARAFVRPSPTSGALGGVHRKTRETMLVCEAAGFDLVIIETVGVGQSETEVAGMVDTFLVLMLAGAGDELQGIKRGLLEVADLLAINKADGDNARNARRARAEYAAALKLMTPLHADWRPPVLTCSALTGDGVHGVWEAVEQHRATLEASGALAARRAAQQRAWMTQMVEQTLLADLWGHPTVQALRGELEEAVEAGRVTPTVAAERLLGAFRDG